MLGGPKREWLAVLGALVFGAALLLFTRGRSLTGGERVSLEITLITADRHELACALAHEVAGFGCAYLDGKQAAQPAPAAPKLLAPYMTLDRRLVLVPALFEQPALSARYDCEPPTGRNTRRLRRFVATCQVELLTKIPKVEVRFGKRGRWDSVSDVWVAKPETCSVKD